VTTSREGERLRGRFWLEGGREHAVSGELFLGAQNPQIKLDGQLTPAIRFDSGIAEDGSVFGSGTVASGEDEPLTVFGDLLSDDGEELVTLVDCVTTGRRFPMGDSGGGLHTLQASYAVRGAHIAGRDEHFTSIRVRLRHLDEWASLPGFEFRPSQEEPSVAFVQPDVPAVSLDNGGSLDLKQIVTLVVPTVVGGGLSRAVWFHAFNLSPTLWRELDRDLVTPLSTLLTLATGVDCPPVAIEVDTGAEAGWLTICGSWLGAAADQPLQVQEMLLPLQVLTMTGVAVWLGNVEKLGPLPVVVAAASAGLLHQIETTVLELATVAEGLARRMWPEDARMTDEKAGVLRELAVSAVAERCPEEADGVKAALEFLQDLSYPMRLLRLAERGSEVVPGVVGRRNPDGRPNRWKTTVAAARNDFAHRLQLGWLDENRIDTYLTVTMSLQFLLTAVLLLETGTPAEVLAERFAQHQPYLQFLRRAREWSPYVYVPAGDAAPGGSSA